MSDSDWLFNGAVPKFEEELDFSRVLEIDLMAQRLGVDLRVENHIHSKPSIIPSGRMEPSQISPCITTLVERNAVIFNAL